MSVFVSYARADDEPFVRRLVAHLTASGLKVWFDRECMPSRSLTFMDEIRRAIDAADRLLVVVGPHAVASEYVRSEWLYALARGKAVTPVLRSGGYELLPPELRMLHCPDVRTARPERQARAEVVRVLTEPMPQLGELHGVPDLPPHFRPRPDEGSDLVARLLADRTSTAFAERWRRVTLLAGMGGAGKSVLAGATARSTSVRRTFPDGVYWLDARDHPGAENLVEALLRSVRGGAVPVGPAGTVEADLRGALRDRRCLVVLDNALDADHVVALAGCLDTPARLLVTTRHRDLVDDTEVLALSGLSLAAGRKLLADWTGTELPHDLTDRLVRRCEGLPFALALCGAMAAQGVPLELVIERVEAADLGFLERRFPGYPHPSLLPMLDASLRALTDRSAATTDLLVSLAVFREGARIPWAALERFWRRRGGLGSAHVAKHLALVQGLSLLRVEGGGDSRAVVLHPLVHDYVGALAGDPTELHGELLAAYGATSGTDLADGPDDGYYHANLVHHLLRADCTDLALTTLTGSPAWLRAKQRDPARRGSFSSDVDLVLGTAWGGGGQPPLDAVVRLRTARHVAQRGPSAWGDSILRAMVAVGDELTALAGIRATVDPTRRVMQLLELHDRLRRAGRPMPELRQEAREIRDAERDPGRRRDMAVGFIGAATSESELAEAAASWLGFRDDPLFRDQLGPQLVVRLLRNGATGTARRIAEHSAMAGLILGVHQDVETGHTGRVLRRLADLPGEPAGTMPRMQTVDALVRAGAYRHARRVARTLDSKIRVTALTRVPDAGAILEAVAAARDLPEPVDRAFALFTCAEAVQRLRQSHPRQSRQTWFRWRRRSASAVLDADVLVRESRREVERVDGPSRRFVLGAHAQWALTAGDPDADLLVAAWRQAIDADAEASYRAGELGSLALALAESGDLEGSRRTLARAVAAAETADNAGNADAALVAVLPAIAAAGHVTVALDRALEIVDTERRERALAALARMCGDLGLPDEVLMIASRSPDGAGSAKYRIEQARAFARRGDVASSLSVVDTLEGWERDSALSEVVLVLAAAGSPAAGSAARRLLATAGPSFASVQACCAVAVALAGHDRAAAEGWLGLAEQSLPEPPGLAHSLSVTEWAAAVHVVRPERAAAAFVSAVNAARSVEESWLSLGGIIGFRDRSRALAAVGKALAAGGLVEDALALGQLVDEDDECRALMAIITARAALAVRRERAPDARDLFGRAQTHALAVDHSVLGTDWRLVASTAVAEALSEAGEGPWALELADRVHPGPDAYLLILGRCSLVPPVETGTLMPAHLVTALDIVGWTRPDWHRLADALRGRLFSADPGIGPGADAWLARTTSS
ncbi:TIR domain-containing protein [Geodermatophilus normandii]|uniref:TIR domain-containing protein n=1 Tax=Geodermatophilus normandii TaxID=1137989 RepID=A0A6P0GCF7_9ACTN|nr:TIR domain-containing protein [Geodermatophilus normandii]